MSLETIRQRLADAAERSADAQHAPDASALRRPANLLPNLPILPETGIIGKHEGGSGRVKTQPSRAQSTLNSLSLNEIHIQEGEWEKREDIATRIEGEGLKDPLKGRPANVLPNLPKLPPRPLSACKTATKRAGGLREDREDCDKKYPKLTIPENPHTCLQCLHYAEGNGCLIGLPYGRRVGETPPEALHYCATYRERTHT